MIYHSKHDEIVKLVNSNTPVLLEGEKGTGKTTLAKQVADTLKLDFYSLSMTRQTTYSHLLGFINVNGIYVPSHIRKAADNGGVVLLDEIDASDPNVILCLNTIENGYLSFPDKIVELHTDFRLMATCNPQDNHKDYNGRSKLDAATLDRFDSIDIETDKNLEKSLIDDSTYVRIELIRELLKKQNSDKYISMRDSLRFQKRKELDLLDGFIKKLLKNEMTVYEQYLEEELNLPKHSNYKDCETLSDLWEFIEKEKT